MDMNKRMRLNELAKDFPRCEAHKTLMREFDESETAYSGINADGYAEGETSKGRWAE